MATSLMQNPYAAQQAASYGYVQTPQPPPSPPIDDSKCSLPSISNLIGLADAVSPTSESSPRTQQQQAQSPQQAPAQESPQPAQQQQPQQMQQQVQQQMQMQFQQQAMSQDTRPSSAHYSQPSMMRGGMPPTPPMGSEAAFDGYPSPAAKSITGMSVVPGPNYYYETTPPLEEPRHMSPALGRMPLQTSYPQQSFGSPYMSQPALPSYYPPMQPTPPPQAQISGLYYQRPLPQVRASPNSLSQKDMVLTLEQQFPPMPVSVGLGPTSGANPWQHHHYISPSSAASFPQSQDRYICPTCNKAFSRPSSLRIHSHSHTGEKPFKCPHPGCGKAFSVRSNMKRHERGCHNYDSSASSLRS